MPIQKSDEFHNLDTIGATGIGIKLHKEGLISAVTKSTEADIDKKIDNIYRSATMRFTIEEAKELVALINKMICKCEEGQADYVDIVGVHNEGRVTVVGTVAKS